MRTTRTLTAGKAARLREPSGVRGRHYLSRVARLGWGPEAELFDLNLYGNLMYAASDRRIRAGSTLPTIFLLRAKAIKGIDQRTTKSFLTSI